MEVVEEEENDRNRLSLNVYVLALFQMRILIWKQIGLLYRGLACCSYLNSKKIVFFPICNFILCLI